jgi:hypothetical protein
MCGFLDKHSITQIKSINKIQLLINVSSLKEIFLLNSKKRVLQKISLGFPICKSHIFMVKSSLFGMMRDDGHIVIANCMNVECIYIV